MKVTRDVILDLLPLYLADEASADTRVLVEHYLENDPELADSVRHSTAIELPRDIPVPLTKENEMKTFEQTKRLMTLRTIALAVVISFTMLCLLGMGLAAWMLVARLPH
jgi:hypothetical protein